MDEKAEVVIDEAKGEEAENLDGLFTMAKEEPMEITEQPDQKVPQNSNELGNQDDINIG